MADLAIDELTVEYRSGDYTVRPVESFSLSAGSGELVLLVGPSGSGKTTLLSCLAGILSPTSGSIMFAGTEVTSLDARRLTEYRRKTVGIVFQAFNLIPSLSAEENVAIPLRSSGAPMRDARQRAAALLSDVGLADRTRHKPGDMSGGQQQRVAIARALALDPPLLLADEPTAHLDYIQVETVLRIIRELAQPGRLVVVATHDDRLMPLADRVVDLAPRPTSSAAGPTRLELDRGAVVFEQGSRGDLIYVIERGEIDLVRVRADGTEEHLDTIGPGDYFGELGPLLGFPRTATARARSDAVITGYTVRDFRDLLGEERLAGVLGAARTRKR